MVTPGTFFVELGFYFFGPFVGLVVFCLVVSIRYMRFLSGPLLLLVVA
jgi:Deoxyxylulose-5-phosphate synthase